MSGITRSSRVSFTGALLVALIAATALTGRPAAAQGDPTFVLVNRASLSIYYVYVSRADSTSWGNDLLGDDVIITGARQRISPQRGTCLFDVKVVYSNDEAEERRNINLCQASELVFTGATGAGRTPVTNADFDLVNNANRTIYRLFVSLVSADGWGDDRLGADTVRAGRRYSVDLPSDGQCRYDIKVEYEDDTTEERRNVNLCEVAELAFDGRGAARPGTNPSTTNPDFEVINRSRQAIYYLYVSPVGQDSWGDDKLPGATISAGATFKVILPRNSECRYDVKVVYEDESVEERRNQNVCTLSDITFNGSSSSPAPPGTGRPPGGGGGGGGDIAYGTGFFVSAQGHALTNNHVAGECRAITAIVNEQRMPAQLIARDEQVDLALIRVTGPAPASFARFRGSPDVRPAESVLVAGFPLPTVLQNGLNVTLGNVSALSGIGGNRSLIQVTAPIQAGNSGGPLFDMGANVIGIVVSKLGNDSGAQNVNFAVQGGVGRRFLESNGVRVSERATTTRLDPGDVGAEAGRVTFQIECRE